MRPANLEHLRFSMKRIKRLFSKPIFVVIGTLIVMWFIIRTFFTAPILSNITFSRAYYDRNGKLLRITLTPDDKYRIFTPLDQISPHIIKAIILYEDKYFYTHFGVNPISVVRAVRQYASGVSRPVGGSTITMQVARLVYDINSKSLCGKIKQIIAAIYIDLFHSKSEILEAYFNLAPYGGNIEGLGAASKIYFGKQAKDLTKIESITLATIPQNPNKRGLNTINGIKNIESMRKNLVHKWVVENPQDSDLYVLSNMPLTAGKISDLPFLAPHLIDNLNTQKNLAFGPHTITTIDINLQQKLEQTLRNAISARKSYGITNAAAILVNYKTMEVLSYIGSADYFNKQIFGQNDGVRAYRSPGSTLKPFIYAMAVDRGLIHGFSLLRDTPINFGVYAPENSDNEFFGPVLAHDALTHSRNVPAINLLREIGINNFYKLLKQFGVNNLRAPEHYGLSVALGGAEVSMLDIAKMYAIMANLGVIRNIKYITNTQDDTQQTVLSPEAFFLTLDMLGRQSTQTTSIPFTKNKQSLLHHYWKTGTSSSYRDAWTAGIFGDFVLVVWVGNFDGKPNNAFSGARAAAPIYFALSDTIIKYYQDTPQPIQNNNFMTPNMNIAEVEMCEIGGNIANAYCPKKTKSYFIPGKSPIAQNSVFRAIPIDKKSGLRACVADPKTTRMAVYEFWDGEYMDMFNRAGIKRKTAPKFMPECAPSEPQDAFVPPIITSPMADSTIVITSNQTSTPIGFSAFSSRFQDKMMWFMDDTILGSTKNGEVLEYNVSMGDHHVRVTDSTGTTNEITFSVIGGK